ncbi:MAG: C80 family cysteine peptidase, partial [Desulfobacterales bacterium]|nr:C80 family cysteine peptidase [Desulfobacterales bacterium]
MYPPKVQIIGVSDRDNEEAGIMLVGPDYRSWVPDGEAALRVSDEVLGRIHTLFRDLMAGDLLSYGITDPSEMSRIRDVVRALAGEGHFVEREAGSLGDLRLAGIATPVELDEVVVPRGVGLVVVIRPSVEVSSLALERYGDSDSGPGLPVLNISADFLSGPGGTRIEPLITALSNAQAIREGREVLPGPDGGAEHGEGGGSSPDDGSSSESSYEMERIATEKEMREDLEALLDPINRTDPVVKTLMKTRMLWELRRGDGDGAEYGALEQFRKAAEVFEKEFGLFRGSSSDGLPQAISMRQGAMLEEIPNRIHMVWIGKLGPNQEAYLNQWARINAGHNEIHLWYDPDAVLSIVLSRALPKYVDAQLEREKVPESERRGERIGRILDLQNRAYAEIVRRMSRGATFDSAAAAFMISALGKTRSELETIRLKSQISYTESIKRVRAANPNAVIQLRNLSEVFAEEDSNREYYYQELGLRGNPASASDISRVEIVRKVGGVYVDMDLLPPTNPDVFDPLEETIEQAKQVVLARRIAMEPQARLAAIDLEVEELFVKAQTRSIQLALQGRGHETISERDAANSIAELNEALVGSEYEGLGSRLESRARDFSGPLLIPMDAGYVYPDSFIMGPTLLGQFSDVSMIGAPAGAEYLNMYSRDIAKNFKMLEVVGGLDLRDNQDLVAARGKLVKYLKMAGLEQRFYGEIVNYRLDSLVPNSRGILGITATLAAFGALEGASAVDYGSYRNPAISQAFESTTGVVTMLTDQGETSVWTYPGPSSAESQAGRYVGTTRNTLVIQLEEDPVTTQSARFLYSKNRVTAHWMVLRDGALVTVDGAPVVLNRDSRITLVGHGRTGTIAGMSPSQIMEMLLRNNVLHSGDRLGRISIVSCTGDDPRTQTAEGAPSAPFAEALMSEADRAGVQLEIITSRSALVRVDSAGRKWTGVPDGDGRVIWSQKNAAFKRITRHSADGISTRLAPVEEDLVVQIAGTTAGALGRDREGRYQVIHGKIYTEAGEPLAQDEVFTEEERALIESLTGVEGSGWLEFDDGDITFLALTTDEEGNPVTPTWVESGSLPDSSEELNGLFFDGLFSEKTYLEGLKQLDDADQERAISSLLEEYGETPDNPRLFSLLGELESRVLSLYTDHRLSAGAAQVVELRMERVKGAIGVNRSNFEVDEVFELTPERASHVIRNTASGEAVAYHFNADGSMVEQSYGQPYQVDVREIHADPVHVLQYTYGERPQYKVLQVYNPLEEPEVLETLKRWRQDASALGTSDFYDGMIDYLTSEYGTIDGVFTPGFLVVLRDPNSGAIVSVGMYNPSISRPQYTVDEILIPSILVDPRAQLYGSQGQAGVRYGNLKRETLLAMVREAHTRYPGIPIRTYTEDGAKADAVGDLFFLSNAETPLFGEETPPDQAADLDTARESVIRERIALMERAVSALQGFGDDGAPSWFQRRISGLNDRLTRLKRSLELSGDEALPRLFEETASLEEGISDAATLARADDRVAYGEHVNVELASLNGVLAKVHPSSAAIYRALVEGLPSDFSGRSALQENLGTPDEIVSVLTAMMDTMTPEAFAMATQEMMDEIQARWVFSEVERRVVRFLNQSENNVAYNQHIRALRETSSWADARLSLAPRESGTHDFDTHVIVLYDADQSAAMHLYNRHPGRSKLVYWDGAQFVDVAGEEVPIRGRVRVALFGHGGLRGVNDSEFLLAGNRAAEVAEQMRTHLLEEGSRIARMDLISCSIEHASGADSGTLNSGFVHDLALAMSRNGITVDAYTYEDGLVTVDHLGRKWSGVLNDDYTYEWRQGDVYRKTTVTLETDEAGEPVVRYRRQRASSRLEEAPVSQYVLFRDGVQVDAFGYEMDTDERLSTQETESILDRFGEDFTGGLYITGEEYEVDAGALPPEPGSVPILSPLPADGQQVETLQHTPPPLSDRLQGQVEDLVGQVRDDGLSVFGFTERYAHLTDEQKSNAVSRLLEIHATTPDNVGVNRVLAAMEAQILSFYRTDKLSPLARLDVEIQLERVRQTDADLTTVHDTTRGNGYLYLDPIRAQLFLDTLEREDVRYYDTHTGISTSTTLEGERYRNTVYTLVHDPREAGGQSRPLDGAERDEVLRTAGLWAEEAGETGVDSGIVQVYTYLNAQARAALAGPVPHIKTHLVVTRAPSGEIAALGLYEYDSEDNVVNLKYVVANPDLLYTTRPDGRLWRGAGSDTILALVRDAAIRYPTAVQRGNPENIRVEAIVRSHFFGDTQTPRLFSSESGEELVDYTDAQRSLLEQKRKVLAKAAHDLYLFDGEYENLPGFWGLRAQELAVEADRYEDELKEATDLSELRRIGLKLTALKLGFVTAAKQAQIENEGEFEEGLNTETLEYFERHYTRPEDSAETFQRIVSVLPEGTPYLAFFRRASGSPNEFLQLIDTLAAHLPPSDIATYLAPIFRDAASGLISRETVNWLADAILITHGNRPEATSAFLGHLSSDDLSDVGAHLSPYLSEAWGGLADQVAGGDAQEVPDPGEGEVVHAETQTSGDFVSGALLEEVTGLLDDLSSGGVSPRVFEEHYRYLTKPQRKQAVSDLLEAYGKNPESSAYEQALWFLSRDVVKFYNQHQMSEEGRGVVEVLLERNRMAWDEGLRTLRGNTYDRLVLDPEMARLALETTASRGVVKMVVDGEERRTIVEDPTRFYANEVYVLNGEIERSATEVAVMPESLRQELQRLVSGWLDLSRQHGEMGFASVYEAVHDVLVQGGVSESTYVMVTRDPDGQVAAIGIYT